MNRRRLIALITAAGAAGIGREAAADARKPRRSKPQPGDVLVHAFGAAKGRPIVPDDVGGKPLFAFPMEDATGLVRDGSLHNELLVVRVAAEALSAKADAYAVRTDGDAFLVYSAACTHTGCEVSGWHDAERRLVCPCHGSEFDVHEAAKVVGGPAPKPLAMLEVVFAEGRFRVAGGFSRRVGAAPA